MTIDRDPRHVSGHVDVRARGIDRAREKQIRSDIPAWLSRSYRGHALTRGGNCRLVQCAMRPRVSQSRHRRRVTSTVAGERAAFSDGRSRPCPRATSAPDRSTAHNTHTCARHVGSHDHVGQCMPQPCDPRPQVYACRPCTWRNMMIEMQTPPCPCHANHTFVHGTVAVPR